MQEDIDLYITLDRLKEASFSRKLNPIAKNVTRRQNLFKPVFRDISTFDTQNPDTGSLIQEIDVEKKI